jgi:hypothetical protein
MALPTFESLLQSQVVGADAAAAKLAVTQTGAPLRMAFVYFPNGAIQDTWWPKGEGKSFELHGTLAPLAKVKQKLQVLGGLDHKNATPGRDGPGDHARASGSFLTGVRVRKTAGADIQAGVSIDQLAARHIGHLTRFPSLELSCDAVRRSGSCDSGYSCAYQYNLAWRSATTPVAPEPNPRLVFERLFGAGSPGERRENLKRRQDQQRSILDFVRDDAQALDRELGTSDRRKLDEFLGSVREIEKRIEKSEAFGAPANPDVDAPPGVPSGFGDYVQLMYDMLVLAFQTDSTRIATFLLANEGSNRAFPEIGIAEGHHYLTHHRGQKDMVEKVAKIDLWYATQLARFLEKLDQTKDVDGRSLLDNSMIVYGSGNADGNRHTHTNLPILLAGGGGGSLSPGRFVKHQSAPATNLFLSMIDRFGVPAVASLGDSTGRVKDV